MAVVTAVVAFDDGAWVDTAARQLTQQARRYPALDIEPLMTRGILTAH